MRIFQLILQKVKLKFVLKTVILKFRFAHLSDRSISSLILFPTDQLMIVLTNINNKLCMEGVYLILLSISLLVKM